MQKYVILMRNCVEGLDIQEKLLQAGFRWAGNEPPHHSIDLPYFLFINGMEGGLSHSSDFLYTAKRIKNDTKVLEDVQFTLTDAFSLEGATLPGKMITVNGKEFSESTLVAALKQYVEG